MRPIREGDEYRMPTGRFAEVSLPCDEHGNVLLVYTTYRDPSHPEMVHVTQVFLRDYCDRVARTEVGVSWVYE